MPSFQNDSHVWRTDCIRDDDKVRMEELMKKLAKCRCKETPKIVVETPSFSQGIITRAGPILRTGSAARRPQAKGGAGRSKYAPK